MQSRDYIKTYADTAASSSAKTATATTTTTTTATTATEAVLRRTAVPSAYALRGLYQGIGTVILATLPACAFLPSHVLFFFFFFGFALLSSS